MTKALIFFLALIISHQAPSQILKKAIPDKLVVLTFDDAPASHYSVVAPKLKEYGFKATFFVCEFPPNFSDSSKYMNWRQMQALDNMGFEVANHSRTHANMERLGRPEMIEQLSYIEEKCDSLGIPLPKNFAYPGYGLSPLSLKVLEEKGYEFARAGGSRAYDPLSDHPYLIPSWATSADNKQEILEALQQAQKGQIVVLTLHGVPDLEHPWVDTPISLFEEYLDYLKENDFQVIAMEDLKDYIDPDKALKAISPDFGKPYKN